MRRAHDSSNINERVEQLAHLRQILDRDLPAEEANRIDATVAQARERLALNPEISVVALVGATGSGKSSLMNALVGADVARVGVRRPTTTEALAACPPGQDSSTLLDWLEIPHRVMVPEGAGLPANVAIIDLPDIDSVDRRNRQIVDRLAQRVDVLVWVADPQKYADQVLHHEFIRPLAHHSQVTLVTLTQVDRLVPADAERIRADLARLVEADGIANPQVIATSSVTGEGLEKLRAAIAKVAQHQQKRAARLHADVDAALVRISQQIGEFDAAKVGRAVESQHLGWLQNAAAKAAGVETIANAVQRAYVHRGMRHCGWMPLRAARSLRADPLKRLHLQGDGSDQVHSMPAPIASEELLHVQARELAQDLGQGRPPVWRQRIQKELSQRFAGISKDLNYAVASTDLRISNQAPASWRLLNGLQWIMWILTAAGAVWLGAIVVARNFLLLPWEPPYWEGLPVPTLIAIGGVAATALVALLSSFVINALARRRKRQAQQALTASVGEVVRQQVWEPLEAELQRQSRVAGVLKTLLARK